MSLLRGCLALGSKDRHLLLAVMQTYLSGWQWLVAGCKAVGFRLLNPKPKTPQAVYGLSAHCKTALPWTGKDGFIVAEGNSDVMNML